MELLLPTPPPQLAGNIFAGPSPATFRHGFGLENQMPPTHMPEIAEDSTERVYVAVGKSVERSVGLLYWTFRQFRVREIALVHVHQPSPTIPTLCEFSSDWDFCFPQMGSVFIWRFATLFGSSEIFHQMGSVFTWRFSHIISVFFFFFSPSFSLVSYIKVCFFFFNAIYFFFVLVSPYSFFFL